jgi:U4/U6.U5 tri-snRNP-associated protein 1
LWFSAVPQAAEFLDPQPLSKNKTEKAKGKKKEITKEGLPQVLDGGFMTVPAPNMSYHSASASPAPGEINGSPAPRPGFSRISTAATEIPSPSGTPVPAERAKVAFGFGMKRKAGEDPNGTPPPKSAKQH